MVGNRLRILHLLPAACLLVSVGCTEPERVTFGDAKLGDSCKQTSDCEPGLFCDKSSGAKTCEPVVTDFPKSTRGHPCTSDADCKGGDEQLWCGGQDLCTPNQPVGPGGNCALGIECEKGLVCSASGTCMTKETCPAPEDVTDDLTCETRGADEPCNPGECQRPYVCGVTDKCVPPPFPRSASCTLSDQERGAYRFYFEVPRPAGGDDDYRNPDNAHHEFYRLPFPTNVRTNAEGNISLAGHASPGEVLGLNFRKQYFDSIEEDNRYFAVNGPVFVRASDAIDLSTICLSDGNADYPDPPADSSSDTFCESGGVPSVYLVHLETNTMVPVEMSISTKSGMYICQNAIGVAPLAGRPLLPESTYALVVTTDVRNVAGDKPLQDRDFAAMLQEGAPGDGSVLDAAHAAMAPLRQWIQSSGVAKSTVAVASVFTTGDPTAVAAKILQAVDAVHASATPPSFGTSVVQCSPTATLPAGCDNEIFACTAENTAFFELRGTYTYPRFQHGELPFEHEGGAFVYDTDGVPTPVQGLETMCYSLAIPKNAEGKAAMPTAGWPVVIYGHGTNGSFVSAMQDGTAELLASSGFAVLAFDNVMHGRRQGSTDPLEWGSPGDLFFNVLNPRAARDNILQGAADILNLVSLVSRPGVEVNATLPDPNGSFVKVAFDGNQIFYFGHSQGTVIAPAFLAVESRVKAVVFSGAGAELALSMLHKKKPVDGAQLLGTLFGDHTLSRVHPFMGIVSQLFAPADAIAYARHFVTLPTLGGRTTATPFLHVMGIGDSYTPDITQHALLRATEIPLVGQMVDPISDIAGTVSSPYEVSGGGVTAGAVQYEAAAGRDGHYVYFDIADAKSAVAHFLTTTRDNSPVIKRTETD